MVDVFGGPHGPQISFMNALLFSRRRDYLFGKKKLFLFVVGLEKGTPIFLIILFLLVWHILFDPFHNVSLIILKI